MELTRIIHPVGQGGFYTETLKNRDGEYNVVYDCGGNSQTFMKDYVKRFIHDAYKPKRGIDAVFISHLHADHVNGLKYLLENIYPKYLILPQLEDDMLLEVIFNNTLSDRRNEKEVNGLITDLYGRDGGYYFESRIIKVNPADGDASVDMEGDNNSIDLSKEDFSKSTINSGSKIHFDTDIPWLYIPYNPPVKSSKAESFYEFIKMKLKISSDFGWAELPNIVMKTSTKKLREIYAQYFGSDHNAYSMTLFSGTTRPFLYFVYCKGYCDEMLCHGCRKRRRFYYRNLNSSPNCLYTGDFDTQNHFLNLKSFYTPFWKTISSIQVPHHGSRNNFDPQMYEYANRGFISVGERNRYYHPNVDTLQGIQGMCCRPIIVTESLSTIQMYQYNI